MTNGQLALSTGIENIQSKIYTIRDLQVMLDKDLAELYNVETRALNQAVKRNVERFPPDFMFQLTDSEAELLVSQNVIPSNWYFTHNKPLKLNIALLFNNIELPYIQYIIGNIIYNYIKYFLK